MGYFPDDYRPDKGGLVIAVDMGVPPKKGAALLEWKEGGLASPEALEVAATFYREGQKVYHISLDGKEAELLLFP